MNEKQLGELINDFNQAFNTRFQNVHQNFAVVLKFCKKHFRYLEKLFYSLRQELRSRNMLSLHNVDHRINQTQNQLDKIIKVLKNNKIPVVQFYPLIRYTGPNEEIKGLWFGHKINITPFQLNNLETRFKVEIDGIHYASENDLKTAREKVYKWCQIQVKTYTKPYIKWENRK